MEKLSKDWLTQGLIDFEYKKYLLLAYLQTARNSFKKVELYPFLADLVFHYRNLVSVRDTKTLIRESFPKEISAEDFQKMQLRFRELVEDDEVMAEIDAIIDFAVPRIQESLKEGTDIYELVEAHCEISPVGVTPLYADEGYLFVTQPPEKETTVYRYQISIYEDSQEQLRSLNTELVEVISRHTFYPYERLKLDLIKRYRDMPNPAAFLLLSRLRVPFAETLMPVAKRLFVKHISRAA
jgi:hypothetical protein